MNGVLALTARAAGTTDGDGVSIGMGLLGVLLTVGLVATVIFLYRSMRTQLKRIDFDPEGLTDEERMRGRRANRPDGRPSGGLERPDGTDGDVNGYKPSTS